MAPQLHKIALLKKRPSWSDKRRYCDDENLQTFAWSCGTGELIDELKRVREILTTAEKIHTGQAMDRITIEMSFEECFITSHTMLIMLLDRLTDYWNSHAQQDLMNIPEHQPFESVSLIYKQLNIMFQNSCDSLLHMRHLYEQLKPETKDLIKRCSGHMQLERSMIAQKQTVAPSSTPFVFQPACGFSFSGREQTHSRVRDRITAIDLQMQRLVHEKNVLIKKQNSEILEVELEMYQILQKMLCKGKDIQDPLKALQYAQNAIAPQRHIIKLNSVSFKNMLLAIPESYPSTWTRDDAQSFFENMTNALEKDHKTLSVAD